MIALSRSTVTPSISDSGWSRGVMDRFKESEIQLSRLNGLFYVILANPVRVHTNVGSRLSMARRSDQGWEERQV